MSVCSMFHPSIHPHRYVPQQADGKGGRESGVRLRVEVHGPTQGLALGMVSQEVSLEDSDAILRTIATAAAAAEAMS